MPSISIRTLRLRSVLDTGLLLAQQVGWSPVSYQARTTLMSFDRLTTEHSCKSTYDVGLSARRHTVRGLVMPNPAVNGTTYRATCASRFPLPRVQDRAVR